MIRHLLPKAAVDSAGLLIKSMEEKTKRKKKIGVAYCTENCLGHFIVLFSRGHCYPKPAQVLAPTPCKPLSVLVSSAAQ